MKQLLIIFFIFSLDPLSAQTQCNCDSNQNLHEIISCNPVVFKNKARLFWQFTCDSSWLSFQDKKHNKTIIFTMDAPLLEYTGRLGYNYATEYKTTFLIQNNVISGCCDPPEFILFDKEKGTIRSELGRLIFYSENQEYPIVIYLDHSSYKPFDHKKINYNYLTVLNVDKNKKYTIPLPKGRIEKTLDVRQENFAEHIFESSVDGRTLTLSYQYQIPEKKDKVFNANITVDLDKYSIQDK